MADDQRMQHGWPGLFAVIMCLAPVLSAQAGNFSAQLNAAPPRYQGTCPATVRFTGFIKAAKPGKVQFKYVRSDGASSPVQTLLFASPGRKPLSTTWTLGSPSVPSYNGWIVIQFVHPQTDRTAPAKFGIRCTNNAR